MYPTEEQWSNVNKLLSDPLTKILLRDAQRAAPTADHVWVVTSKILPPTPADACYLELSLSGNTHPSTDSMHVFACSEAVDSVLHTIIDLLSKRLNYGSFSLPKHEWTGIHLGNLDNVFFGFSQPKQLSTVVEVPNARMNAVEFYETYCSNCGKAYFNDPEDEPPCNTAKEIDPTDCPRGFEAYIGTKQLLQTIYTPPHAFTLRVQTNDNGNALYSDMARHSVRMLLTHMEADTLPDTLRMWSSPFPITNVYDSGNICWGGQTPRICEVPQTFWASPFNNDLAHAETPLLRTPEGSKKLSEHPRAPETRNKLLWRLHPVRPTPIRLYDLHELEGIEKYYRPLDTPIPYFGRYHLHRNLIVFERPWTGIQMYTYNKHVLAIKSFKPTKKSKDLFHYPRV